MCFKFQIVMRINYYFFCLIINLFFISTTAYSQAANFDETWKEFLDNNKISNMSDLNRPNKASDRRDYAKYVLMNTNSSFCQSKIGNAENLMAEIQEMNIKLQESIPGFVEKKEDLAAKIKFLYDGLLSSLPRGCSEVKEYF